MKIEDHKIEPIYDRVTEVLLPFTGVEFVNEEILQYTGERGTKVHKYIEDIIKGWHPIGVEENILHYLKSFEKFWESSSHVFDEGEMILEKRLFCHDLKVTGQMDVIVKCPDRTYLIDWKTSASKQKSWDIQGAAYRYLCEKENFCNVDDVLFVKLDKTGKKPTLYKDGNYEKSLEIFLKCLDIYRYFDMKNTRTKKRR